MTSELSNYDALVDSDAFVGLMWEADLLHEKAKQLFSEARAHRFKLVTTSFVVAETATVLSDRSGQDAARAFLSFVEKIPTIHITDELQQASLTFFKEQPNKHTSVVDCSNIVVM